MKTTALLTAIIIFFAQSSLLSQENNWQLILANGDTLSVVSLQALEGDSVAIAFSNTQLTKWVPVDSIVELRKIKESRFWKSIAIGTVAGTYVGILTGLLTYEKPPPSPNEFNIDLGPELNVLGGALTGSLAGFLMGGIVGAFSGADEIYKLSKLGPEQKLKTILAQLGR